MPKISEKIVGKKFGRLTVLRQHPVWTDCVCDCGGFVRARMDKLKTARIVSCGCIRREQSVKAAAYRQQAAQTNVTRAKQSALKQMPLIRKLHGIWKGVRKRCERPASKEYGNYGGRGVVVSEDWQNFMAFVFDMAAGWERGKSINRKDNDGPYSRENCEWATPSAQMRNTRRSVVVEDGEKKLTLAEYVCGERCITSEDTAAYQRAYRAYHKIASGEATVTRAALDRALAKKYQ